jgi:pilus assembly protein CpaF
VVVLGAPVSEDVLDHQLVRALQGQVADAMTAHKQTLEVQGQPELRADDERQLALSLIRNVVRQHMRVLASQGGQLPDPGYEEQLAAAIDAAMYGAGRLQELLDDPDVENIDINGPTEVWITRADGSKRRGRPVAASDDDLIDIIRTLGAYAGRTARPFTPASPQLDLRLPDGSRLSAVMRATQHPALSIRRNRYPLLFLAEIPPHITTARGSWHSAGTGPDGTGPGGTGSLGIGSVGRSGVDTNPVGISLGPNRGGNTVPRTLLELGTVTDHLAAFLTAAVQSRCNLMIAGATDAGKTTLLRALVHCIPPWERLVTVERALELGVGQYPQLHPDVLELEEVLPDPDGGGGLTIGDLVRRTRRLNPSRVIVGEVLGPEVVEMLSAMSQGNDGSLSTIHARSADDVFNRLATYAAQHESLPFPVTHSLIGGAIDYVLFIAKNPRLDGRRTVTEVLEVTGSSDGHVTRSQIFTPSRADGRAVRDPEIPLVRAAQLAEAGYDDAGWYEPGLAYGN